MSRLAGVDAVVVYASLDGVHCRRASTGTIGCHHRHEIDLVAEGLQLLMEYGSGQAKHIQFESHRLVTRHVAVPLAVDIRKDSRSSSTTSLEMLRHPPSPHFCSGTVCTHLFLTCEWPVEVHVCRAVVPGTLAFSLHLRPPCGRQVHTLHISCVLLL